MSYTELMSHLDKKLEDHLENVAEFSKDSFNYLSFDNNELFSEISNLIGLGHDFAKSTSFFQEYLLTKKESDKTPHSFLSAIFTYYIVDNYLTDNGIDFDIDLAIISYIVVLHHHGNIKNITDLSKGHRKKLKVNLAKKQLEDLVNSEVSLDEFYKSRNIFLSDFFDRFEEIYDSISIKLISFDYYGNIDCYFYILLFYSVLLDADKMDASNTDTIARKSIPAGIVDDFKKKHFDVPQGINIIREKAYQEVNANVTTADLSNNLFSINLPTGIGKTLTGLSAALKLKNRIYNELNINTRIIYSLPFLSVIDQNEKVIKNIFDENNLVGSDFLLKHNHLAKVEYKDKNEIYDIDNSKILIEGWNSEFIITTFIQFFYSILGNRNSFLRKFHNIANSIIVLDEIQSIPHKYWGILNFLLKKLAVDYNCWIILMTATQPLIFKENEIMSLVDNVEYYFSQFDRVDYCFNLDDITLDEFSSQLLDVIDNNDSKDIMVVLNTISSSKEIYDTVKNHFIDHEKEVIIDEDGICHIGDETDLIYLSTNIVPLHRQNKIASIKKSDKRKIIITTQLIEAGVDIDVDIIYRDFAPLDSIIQTAGRCNREYGKEKGQVNIISLVNDKNKRYSSQIYDNLLLNTTREVLKDIYNISEKDFNLEKSIEYFELISNRSYGDEELTNCLDYLRFEDISAKFKLIKNEIPKVDVFVCINREAEDIFRQYENIVENYKSFERKNAFLKIKNKFYNYVISVDEENPGSLNTSNEICVVCPSDLNRKYGLDLGFIHGDDEDAFII